MEKEFVPYDRALRMKAIGFDEPCFSFYMGGFEELGRIKYVNPSNVAGTNVLAPTFSQAFRWFREKHDLHLLPIRSVDKWYSTFGSWIASFESYEQAELACLDKLLEIVEGITESK